VEQVYPTLLILQLPIIRNLNQSCIQISVKFTSMLFVTNVTTISKILYLDRN